jgi:predicted HTH domain antitoxin
MALLLDDKELKKYNLSEAEFRIEMATHLYEIGKMSIGQATKFSGLNRIGFQKELSRRKIDLKISVTDLHHDIETLKSLGF